MKTKLAKTLSSMNKIVLQEAMKKAKLELKNNQIREDFKDFVKSNIDSNVILDNESYVAFLNTIKSSIEQLRDISFDIIKKL